MQWGKNYLLLKSVSFCMAKFLVAGSASELESSRGRLIPLAVSPTLIAPSPPTDGSPLASDVLEAEFGPRVLEPPILAAI